MLQSFSHPEPRYTAILEWIEYDYIFYMYPIVYFRMLALRTTGVICKTNYRRLVVIRGTTLLFCTSFFNCAPRKTLQPQNTTHPKRHHSGYIETRVNLSVPCGWVMFSAFLRKLAEAWGSALSNSIAEIRVRVFVPGGPKFFSAHFGIHARVLDLGNASARNTSWTLTRKLAH